MDTVTQLDSAPGTNLADKYRNTGPMAPPMTQAPAKGPGLVGGVYNTKDGMLVQNTAAPAPTVANGQTRPLQVSTPSGSDNTSGQDPLAGSWHDPLANDMGAQHREAVRRANENSADALNARITRETFDYYQNTFFDREEALLRDLNDPALYAQRVDEAGQDAATAFAGAQGIQQRQLGRYGLNLPPAVRAAMDRRMALQETGAIADARNNMRLTLDDRANQIRQNMIGFGRNLSDLAADGAGNAHSLAANRIAANNSMKAQSQAAAMQGAGMIAGLAIMALCSRDFKEAVVPMDTRGAIQDLEALRLVEFRYQPEQQIPGQWLGVIAEETPARFVADDGRQVNLHNVLFALVAAVQQLSDRVAELELDKGVAR